MLILASASPRRKELLSLITNNFEVVVSRVEESVSEGLSPMQLVQELAFQKAQEVAVRYPQDVVIGADTIVSLENKLLGKPRSKEEAFEMLSLLSGQFHQVYTGVSIQQEQQIETFYRHAHVQFAPLAEWEIWEYIDTGEPMDKAGAYGIQDKGARFVKGIQGDYFSVMGLPVQAVYEALKTFSF